MCEETLNCVKEFYYQKYWTRVFCLVIIVFFLPTVEKNFLRLINVHLETGTFFIISTIITFITAFLLFKPLGKVFEKKGQIVFLKDSIVIHMHNKEKISVKDIIECTLEKRYLYGIHFAILRVEYIKAKRKKEYAIISEDITKLELKESSLWSVYCSIKERIE